MNPRGTLVVYQNQKTHSKKAVFVKTMALFQILLEFLDKIEDDDPIHHYIKTDCTKVCTDEKIVL